MPSSDFSRNETSTLGWLNRGAINRVNLSHHMETIRGEQRLDSTPCVILSPSTSPTQLHHPNGAPACTTWHRGKHPFSPPHLQSFSYFEFTKFALCYVTFYPPPFDSEDCWYIRVNCEGMGAERTAFLLHPVFLASSLAEYINSIKYPKLHSSLLI